MVPQISVYFHTDIYILVVGIAGGALATILGVAGGTMAAWKSHRAEQERGQTRIITEALKETTGNEEIVQLLNQAFVIITEVAYQLRFTFAHQLEHLQLPRDLR